MRRELLLIALLLTIVHPDFAKAQSLTAPSTQKSSRIDLKGLTKKADSGNTAAQFQLGLAYHFGNGVGIALRYFQSRPSWSIPSDRFAMISGSMARLTIGPLRSPGARS